MAGAQLKFAVSGTKPPLEPLLPAGAGAAAAVFYGLLFHVTKVTNRAISAARKGRLSLLWLNKECQCQKKN